MLRIASAPAPAAQQQSYCGNGATGHSPRTPSDNYSSASTAAASSCCVCTAAAAAASAQTANDSLGL